MNPIVSDNQRLWDSVADLFVDASSLPVWGPFGVGDDLGLVSEIEGRTFLEIGCGSGRSIRYLVERGAKKVYGLDLSPKQLAEAARHNRTGIESGQVQLIQGPMEERARIEPVDQVISVYALGWTPEPAKTLTNIYSYLKPGGRFTWSWDHSFFADTWYKDGQFIVDHSYHNEVPRDLPNWKNRGASGNITYRKASTWFQLLRDAGFEIVGYHEPPPKNLDGGHDDPTKYYSIQKAKIIPATLIFDCRKPEL